VKAYGDAVWNRWLASHYGQELIRNAWERSQATIPASFAPGAYDAALSGRGSSFFAAFTRFAADSAEWRSAAGPFHDADGVLWRDVQRASKQVLAPGSGSIGGRLDHTSYALLNVARTRDARIKLIGSLPKGTAGALALVGRVGAEESGAVQVVLTRLRNGGTGVATLPNPGRFTRITAVLVNADAESNGYSRITGDWNFARDGQSVSGRVSNRFAPLRLLSVTPAAGARVSRSARVALRFSAAVSPGSLGAIRLVDAHGKGVATRRTRSDGGRLVTLVPKHALGAGARYTVQVGARVVDVDQNALSAPQPGLSFRTKR
jgi:hypothetical protein